MSTILHWLGPIAIVVVVFTIIGIPIWFWESRKRRRKIEEAFADRQSMDERTFYERYFEARGVPFFVVSKVRKVLEDELNADLSRLAAEDDFKRNLSFFWQFESMADVEIVVRLEEEFEIKITDAEAGQTDTVEDLINLVWLKVRQRAA
ncbi:MAG TPA: phosphopantetheine-binding protein [Pyrinomonadaceae bacterium]|nr:phosphopantetheine-binding protein [Pyrinomonadaceae bacterium]